MAKKRDRLELMYEILLAIRKNGNKIGPTRLLYASNLSSQMFKEYTGELLEKVMIKEVEEKNKRFYTLTKKGNEFIEKYKDIIGFIDNFGL